MKILRLTSMLPVLALCACASDNVHMPEPESPDSQIEFQGTVTSEIPVFPSFDAIVSDDYSILNWADKSHRLASIELGQFFVYISVTDLSFDIGPMVIDDIVCMPQADGSYTLSNPDFSCQAGEYFTTGSLAGSLSADGSKIAYTITYRPGSMPFDVKTVYEGAAKPN